MCFINSKLQAEPLIAKENMIVYKLLYERDNEYFSPYFKAKWKIGKLKTLWFFNNERFPKELGRGFHAYLTKGIADAWNIGIEKKLCKMEIPKGTKYWENGYEIVSNKMRLIEVL